jgi:DNA-binding GntR family transcriptional regulator
LLVGTLLNGMTVLDIPFTGQNIIKGLVNLLTGRINYLRSMTIRTERRNVEGPAQMKRIVDAIRARNGKAAQRAASEHVAKASSIALRVLDNEKARRNRA